MGPYDRNDFLRLMGEEHADLETAVASTHQEEEVAGSAVLYRSTSAWTCVQTTPSRKKLLVNTCERIFVRLEKFSLLYYTFKILLQNPGNV